MTISLIDSIFSLLTGISIESTDPLIHDKVKLLVAKYYYEDLDFNEIPSNIYNYIICFMFEMIYGTDLKTPATRNEF
jgi:hypothetical protein